MQCCVRSDDLSRKILLVFVIVLLAVLARAQGKAQGNRWEPIPPEDLALKDNRLQPGAPAMILYRESIADNDSGVTTNYHRIKIFTEEGRDYGNIEVSYSPADEKVESIQARVVQPDGSETEFRGEVQDKVLVKTRGFTRRAKVIVLPDVRPGSIIEYRYTVRQMDRYQLYLPKWQIQDRLFTRRARFRLQWYISGGSVVDSQKRKLDKLRWIGFDEKHTCDFHGCELNLENIPAH
jgi:hypothetical protein